MDLPDYKRGFIEFLIRSEVLIFGDFVTKSGRSTPYFVNIGKICHGSAIEKLGEFYAHAIVEQVGGNVDNLYGPAYKGISLVVSTSIALKRLYDRDVSFTFNRKEAKDHGEKGVFIGHRYEDGDRVVILEDVVTAGTSIRESVPLLKTAADVDIAAVVMAVNRQERGPSGVSAVAEIDSTFGFPAFGIVSLDEIVAHLHGRDIDGKIHINDDCLTAITRYRNEYGAA